MTHSIRLSSKQYTCTCFQFFKFVPRYMVALYIGE